MKNYLLILMLISISSCKENEVIAQEKKPEKAELSEEMNYEIQEIGNLYKPEKMIIKQNKIRTDNEKENYQITLTNSDLLDSDTENLKKHAEKIANFYFKNLSRNIVPLNCRNIIVEIEHRNGKKDNFKYSEKEMKKIIK